MDANGNPTRISVAMVGSLPGTHGRGLAVPDVYYTEACMKGINAIIARLISERND